MPLHSVSDGYVLLALALSTYYVEPSGKRNETE